MADAAANEMDDIAPVKPGDLLAGKYRVQAVLGQGAMGVVVAAIHEDLGQKFALKFLLPDALKSEDAVARFTREARAMVKIQSEHIARVSDVGRLEDGAPYMVMEYLQGRDLGAVLEEGGPMSIELAVDYTLQACEAIAEAHANGIVHRDLKPANMFLTRRADGSSLVKVLDFGIAKSLDELNGSATNAGTLLGSPYYMSPEQLRSSSQVDKRSDIWALGVILYELLTGKPVFNSDTMAGLCGAILTDPVPPLREALPTAPEGLETAILGCLQRDLARRHQNCAELARALRPFAPKASRVSIERITRMYGEGEVLDTVPPPSAAMPAPGARTNGPWSETQDKPAPARRAGFVGLAVAGLLAIGVIAGIALRKGEPPRTEAPAQPAAAPAPPPPAPPEPVTPPAPRPEVVPAVEPAASAAGAPTTSAAPAHAAASKPRTVTAKPVSAKASAATKPARGGSIDPLDGRK